MPDIFEPKNKDKFYVIEMHSTTKIFLQMHSSSIKDDLTTHTWEFGLNENLNLKI